MKIEVFEVCDGEASSISGEREVWVKVLSNEVHDWPEVKAALTDEQAEAMCGAKVRPHTYYPHLVSADEKAEHGYAMEDWFVFKFESWAVAG